MSLTNTGTPTYLWDFQSTTIDTVSSLTGSILAPVGFTNLKGAAALVSFGSNTCVQFTGAPGTYSFMHITGAANFQSVSLLTSNLFVEAWIYPSSFTANTIAASTGTTFQNWWFGLDNTGKVTATFSGQSVKSVAALTLSTWNHVAFSWVATATSNTIYVFTNGTMSGTAPFTGVPVSTIIGASVYVGANTTTSLNFSGYIQDVRMVNPGKTGLSIVPTASFTPTLGPFPFYNGGSPYGNATITTSGQAVTFQAQFQSLSYTSGIYGQAMKILGFENGIIYNTSLSSSSGFTVSCWLNPNGPLAQISQVVIFVGSAIGWARMEFTQGGLNTAFLTITSAQISSSGTVGAGIAVTSGTWVHQTIVFKGNSITSYINGVLSGSPRVSADLANLIYPTIQVGHNGCANFSIDDLRIYKFAMNATQIAGIYNAAPTSILPEPTLMWPFQSSNLDCITGMTPFYSTVTTSTQVAPSYVTGKYGQAISFVNTVAYSYPLSNSYITYNINKNVGLTANNLTSVFWYQPLGVGNNGNQSIFQVLDSVAGSVYIYIQNQSANSGIQYVASTGGTLVGTLIPPNTWAHVAIVTSNVGAGTNNVFCSYYLNGSSQGTSNITLSSTGGTISSFWLASQNNGGTNGSHPAWCSIQDLRVYNSSLTSDQVSSIYNATSPANLITTPTFSFSGQSVSPNLWWTFENTTTDLVQGLSRYTGYALTPFTNTYISGKYGNAVQLLNSSQGNHPDNTLQYVLSPSLPVSGGITITLWTQLLNLPISSTSMFFCTAFSGGSFFFLAPTTTSLIGFGGTFGGNLGYTATQGTWFFTALTISSSGVLTSYINNNSGIVNGTSLGGSSWVNFTGFALGAGYGNGPTYSISCAIDDVRIYNQALSALQIASVYNQAAVPIYNTKTWHS
jgi:Concanavalin A-like lectin/glucanases superfamily